ncbi:MAG: hypothetical protein DRG71_04600 [Deltaproteobacteria bacterium]|nr:MAG: hypothetical protein DRG71_04600 [Deltaproteobacteria bacterium]
MGKRFITFQETDEQGNETYYVGIELKVDGHTLKCPVSEGCLEYSNLDEQIASLQQELQELRDKVRSVASMSEEGVSLDFPSGTPAEEIWEKLCEISDEESFVAGFNSLPDVQRMEVAEHVLTHCNIFSGRAAVFSARYNSESGVLE